MEIPLTNKELFINNEHGWFIYHPASKVTFVKEGLMAGWTHDTTTHYYHKMYDDSSALMEGIELKWDGDPFNLDM